MGIDKFVEYARSKVLTYVAEWEKTINRIGRWVDFDNSYKPWTTLSLKVFGALGELNKKNFFMKVYVFWLIVRDVKHQLPILKLPWITAIKTLPTFPFM